MEDIRQLLKQATLDPVAFFGDDIDGRYRDYAQRLHPDRGGNKDDFQKLVELRDFAKQPPVQITSSKAIYSIRSQLGRGDLCDVFYAVFDGKPYVLKRPYVELPAANNLMAKEREALEQLHEKAKGSTYAKYLSVPVESFVVDKKRINVFEWRDGLFTGQQIIEVHKHLDGRHLAWMFKRMLTILGFIHNAGWVHGAIVPQHTMFSIGDHGLQLVGWIHSEANSKPIKVVPAGNKSWYPTDKIASPAFDIWMAAKTIMYLAGGDPATNTFPPTVHPLMRQFMMSCVLPRTKLFQEDAWHLNEQFTDLLDQLYGPPCFVPLEM